ncbi:Gfo/Idh/MocA family oxidoreductase [Nocardia asteroides]|uniref:Gfo/Idh/MocA family protein n=1 Tax=Nocardia asteroides TaxID=1824 RepID=UPI001E4577AA|nr:Gfo/Idh/MocA family oxidoreductase [Nocardia asteroides]UGT52722.1 Gfo/Idh/MocA family oxidoreductase [Nocardia asteroides]
MDQLGVAIIGYGLAGSVFHAPLVAAESRMRVASVVTSSAERAERARAEHPGVRVWGTVAELFAEDEDVDLAVIATPNSTHAPLALQALAAGLPVVIDKPFAVRAADAEEVVEAAERADLPLTVFQNRRWDNDFLTLRGLLEEGKLGEVRRFESRFERWRPELKGGWREQDEPGAGIMFDLGSHLVDQALTLFGPVTEVYAELDRRRPGAAADDDAFIALTHASGTRSHLWMSAVAPQLGPRMRVLGSTAGYTVHGLDPQEDDLRAGRRPDDETLWGTVPPEQWGTLGAGDDLRTVPTLPGDYPAFYSAMAATLLDGAPVPVDPRDAVETLRILEYAHHVASAAEE